ncbi:MAG: hypothetical protein EB084_11615 [Proteobacteria bacterium]|nr:hypothetical protein [Pseudomonadota bacterium]
MDKETNEKPVLTHLSEDATKRMWDTTGRAEATPNRPAVDMSEVAEVKCDYCGSMVRMRRGQRCPVCNM